MLNPKHPETGEERSKPEIDALLRDALAARGISPSSTRVGCHIIVGATCHYELKKLESKQATLVYLSTPYLRLLSDDCDAFFLGSAMDAH